MNIHNQYPLPNVNVPGAAYNYEITRPTEKIRSTQPAGVPPELLERLGALGYVSPGGPAGDKDRGADRKDKNQGS